MTEMLQYLPRIKDFFEFLLIALSIVTTFFCFLTVWNLYKLNHLILSWKNNRITGFPIGASVLSVVALGVLVAGLTLPTNADVWMLLLYGWSTLCWLAASYLSSKCYISETGIMPDINDRSSLLAWDRIMDFVVRKEGGKRIKFTFFYLSDYYENNSGELKRLEIQVPENRAGLFQSIVDLKLNKCEDIKLIPEKRFELPH